MKMLRNRLTKTITFTLAESLSPPRFGIKIFCRRILSPFTRNIAELTDKTKAESGRNGGLKTIDSLPGPKLYPLIGNVKHFQNGLSKIHITQYEGAKKYGPVYRDCLFGTSMIMVQDPEICKEV